MRRPLSVMVTVALVAALLGGLQPAGVAHATGYAPPPLKVAVVRSDASQAWLNKHAPTFHYGETQWRADETYLWLSGHGWNVTEVGDSVFGSLSSLKAYDVVVLPYVFCMDPKPSANLQQYVKEGGGVVALLGSPRIAPAYDVGPTTEAQEHWSTILDTRAMEWGPMSEVYQTLFINDPGAPRYKNVTWPGSNSSPVLAGARDILNARGLPGSDLTLDRSFSGAIGGGFELTTFLRGNNNVQPIYSFVINTSQETIVKQYPALNTPGGYPSAVSAKYYDGRAVYYDFCLADFFKTAWYGGIGGHQTSTGVAQREIAGAMLEASVVWAGTHDGTKGVINRDGRTWAEMSVYNDGIYATQKIGVFGNVSLSGQAYFRIYDPSGTLVFSKRHPATYTGTYPGAPPNVLHYSYVPGPLKAGKYRVEVEYVFGYPQMDRRYKEVAYVVKGQGSGIKTAYVVQPTKAPTISRAYFGPNPISPNGDGWNDWGYVTYSTDQAARVSTKIYTLDWKAVAVPESNVFRNPGRYSLRFSGVGLSGTQVPAGAYRYSIQANNELGGGSSGGFLYVSPRLGKAPALGTKPVIGSVTATGTGAAHAVAFKLSADGWTTAKVFGPTGAEIRTLANNGRLRAGDRVVTWDGRDSSGRLLANGKYRFYVFVSSGGTTPATSMTDGVFQLVR